MTTSSQHPEPAAVLVREYRKSAGFTQRQLALAAGLSVGVVRDLEQGRTGHLQPESVRGLTSALGLDQHRASALASAAGGDRPGRAEPQPNGTGQLRLYALGPLAVWRDAHPVVQGAAVRRAVLGLLALHPNTGLHRDMIIDALWPANPVASAANRVQAHVSALRRVLDPGRSPRDPDGLLVSSGTSYRLQVGTDQLDVLAFRELAERARAIRDADTEAACGRYADALRLWRGVPLADLDLLRSHPAVAELSRQHEAVVAEFADAAFCVGWHGRVLPHLRGLADREPLNEMAHAYLMMALAGCGQQASALEVYEELRRRLDEQLGVRPGPQLAEAHLRILRQDIPVPTELAAGNGGGTGLPGYVVPRQLPGAAPHFVGRAAELHRLSRLLDDTPIAVLAGTAGVGKSALAVHWARQVADEFPDGQLYLNLRGFGPTQEPTGPADALREFLGALGVAPERIPAGLDARTALYRSMLAGRRMLVILDNARDEPQVRPLLPGEPGCQTVVTSRRQLAGLAATEGATLLRLDVLSDAESLQLLAARLGTARVAAEQSAAAELTGLCARLPLALCIAAARAAAGPAFALAAITEQLRDARSRLDALEAGDAATSMRAVFSWSCHHLSEPAARMFRLIGLHPHPDISRPAAASLAGESIAAAASPLAELTGAHLITEHVPGRFGIHDLLRAYAAERAGQAESAAVRRAAVRRVLDHYLHTGYAADRLLYPHRDPITLPPLGPGVRPERPADLEQALAWFRAEHQVLLAAVTLAAGSGFDTHAWQIPWTLTDYLSRQGHWHDWAASQQVALAAAERTGDRNAQARVHRDLGHAQTELCSHQDARAHYERALELYRESADLTGQGRACHDLAWGFERQHRYREALECAWRAVRVFREAGHRDGEAEALNEVAWVSANLGDHQSALGCGRQAIKLLRAAGNQRGQADAWDTLGYAHSKLGHWIEAAFCYGRSLGMARELGDLYHQAMVMFHIGDCLEAAGHRAAARDAWRESLPILDDLGHPDAAQVRDRLRYPAG
jgi:DNA-binding SARP family transcriptional activator